jgi:hypothetical protein
LAAANIGQSNSPVYAVGRKVSDFPTNEDLSTPEAAYATIERAYVAEGDAMWRRLSVRQLAQQMPTTPSKPVTGKRAEQALGAEVLEVWFDGQTNAAVFARVPEPRGELVDIRYLELEGARWLNRGNDVTGTLAEARKLFARRCAYREAGRKLVSRPPIAQPAEYLRPFVEFLKHHAKEPAEYLLESLAARRVVILGEVHHRPRYWAFNAALVKQPEFAQRAGVIYLELPSNDQALVDQFLAAPKYDPQPVIEMLRDMLWMGWPDQPMLDFFKTVWETNQGLRSDQRLRIVLVDMARPWKEIKTRNDWRQYEVNRDQFMATNITRDLRDHATDARHAFFIVGYMHAMVNLAQPGGEPVKSAGWHLRETLGDTNVLAVFPHSPVMSNDGEVNGRLALGLFETAFAALTNRPMAFPLEHSPFGEQVFDASPEYLTTDSFRNGYHAYLYLGPLEEELFSPMIPGFYTDEFVPELERRSHVMFGKGLSETFGIKPPDAAHFVRWMSRSWGQPRHAWKTLGPLNAWQLGSDWERKSVAAKLQDWSKETGAMRQAAARLFAAIRKADYENPGDWRTFPAPDADYRVHSDAPGWMRWICQRFRTNPIVAVELGEVARQADSRPALSYRATLQDGARLEGVLPLEWDVRAQTWLGVEGLDWHLPARPGHPKANP